MGASQNRAIYEHFLTQQETQQLLFIHRALAVNGYRPHVRSLTLFDVVLAEPRLLPPLVHVRQLVLDAVEEHFDKPCQVFVEHTSLISWGPGASIGWHHDSNREYLAQRHFSAVLYLNSSNADFSGGTFCFQSGRGPLRIQPSAGMLLLYTADASNVHQVEPVTAGERATLTMWFTLEQEHQEDKKVSAAAAAAAAGALSKLAGSKLPTLSFDSLYGFWSPFFVHI
ncbi:hypothetical protein OEZ85_010543 [Tetradesmus obliquus]|uniref:procollagen-proline 3-dioxygenase n=1 Tax=Tetradesmus obliquus TaxID=3088 RepID=A0ABY8TRG1_TETOB|nr:hypothetical protein OEZ85_010543 [Tetradesmus obliquus]